MSALTDLIPRLMRATADGKIPWKPTAGDAFEAATVSGSIRLESNDGGHPITLSILHPTRSVLDVIATDENRPGPWLPWEEQLLELYSEARREARGVNRVIEGIAKEFGLRADDDDIPF